MKDVEFFLISYLFFSQIWLNFLKDDCHFTYITKKCFKKKKLGIAYLFVTKAIRGFWGTLGTLMFLAIKDYICG